MVNSFNLRNCKREGLSILHSIMSNSLSYYLFNIPSKNETDIQDIQNRFLQLQSSTLSSNISYQFSEPISIFDRILYLVISSYRFDQKSIEMQFKNFPPKLFQPQYQIDWLSIHNIDSAIVSNFIQPALELLHISPVKITYLPSEQNPRILFFKSDKQLSKMHHILKYLLKLFQKFNRISPRAAFSTKSEEIPFVIVKTADPEAFDYLKIIIENSLHIPIQDSGIFPQNDNFYILVENNEQAWSIISNLNFIIYKGIEIPIVHYFDSNKINEIKSWNMKLTDLSNHETPRSLFYKYSHLQPNEESKIVSLHLDPATAHPRNAYIQFLCQEDEQRAKNLDTSVKSSSYSDISMLVYYFAGNEIELTDLFPGAIKAYSLPSNASLRPIYSVQFSSQLDLSNALQQLGISISTTGRYQLKIAENIGMFSNGLRILGFKQKDFPKFENINKVLNHLSKKAQETNGIKIKKLLNSVQLNDVINALTASRNECYLETCVLINRQAFASFHYQEDFNRIMEKKSIEILGKTYSISVI